MRNLDLGWVTEQLACGPQAGMVVKEFGEQLIPLNRVTFDRCQAAGINILWAGVRLLDAAGRRDLIAFTIRQRNAAIVAVLGRAAPAVDQRAAEAVTARAAFEAAPDDTEARKRLMILKDLDDDGNADAADVRSVDRAIAHCLRAVSSAGLDEEPVETAILEFMAAKVLTP